jgi:peroxiredoxin Q/BCP
MSHLKVGQKAPAFNGINQDGEKISLADYKGKRVVIYFYPKDSTPACTVQACNLRDNYTLLKNNGVEIIGVSADDKQSHQKFITKHKLPFPLIADTNKKIIEKYGVWGKKKLFGVNYLGILRTTFVIDEKGVIIGIIIKPKSKHHTEEIMAYF